MFKVNDKKDGFLEENKIIFKKYIPIKKIDNGAFGSIYSVVRKTDKKLFAMKTEKINSSQKTLESEAYYLYNLQGGLGFPKLITFGHTKKFNILIETLLDKSLYKLFVKNKTKCNIIDVCLIGIQILDRLEFIHSKDLIYRDIKPENFLIGIDDPNVIYIVDFGLCKKYRSSKTGRHILPKTTGKFNGTLIYASPNVVKGKESSRRDDLISLGYMLIYLFKRKLPWETSFKDLDKSKYFELIYLKETDGCNELFKNIPKEFTEYIKYTRNLKFEENPDYSYLRSLFNKVLFVLDSDYKKLTFSWVCSENKKISRNISFRRSTPQHRILKSIKDEKNSKEKQNIQTLSLNNIKNNEFNISVNEGCNKSTNELNRSDISNIHKKILELNNINVINNKDKIKSESIFFNNNNITFNNIYSEKVFLNNNNSFLKNIKSIDSLGKTNFNKENIVKRSEIKKSNNNKYFRTNGKNKRLINFNTSNVISEQINFNNFKINQNNPKKNINWKEKQKEIIYRNIAKSKSPLVNRKINYNFENTSESSNNKTIYKLMDIKNTNLINTKSVNKMNIKKENNIIIPDLSNNIIYKSPIDINNLFEYNNSTIIDMNKIKYNNTVQSKKKRNIIKNNHKKILKELNNSNISNNQIKNKSLNYSNIVCLNNNIDNIIKNRNLTMINHFNNPSYNLDKINQISK